MQKALLWTLCFALLVGGAFAAGKAWSDKRRVLAESDDVDHGFAPIEFPLQQRPFVIFICGYNNGAFVGKTLRSVFSQAYDAYRVIYIDDASPDGSFEAASDAIYGSGQMLRTTVVRNEERLGPLANLVRAAEMCQDDEIFVVLDGEDWLAHEWVLSHLNRYYADPDLWMAYGQYCEFPSYKLGGARSFKKSEWSALRGAPCAMGHLKTFYAGLFRKIRIEDLMQQGAFLPAALNLAVMLPLLEMAGVHVQFVPEVLYVVNRRYASAADPELEARCERAVRSLQPYQPLVSLRAAQEEGL